MTRRSLRFSHRHHSAAALVAACAIALPLATQASEGGVTNIVPGGTATLIDLPPTQPGWNILGNYLNYKGNGESVVAALDVESSAYLLGAFYTFDTKVLGAYFTMGATVPYVSVDVIADVNTPDGPFRITDRRSGLGDAALIPAMLAWQDGSWSYSTFLNVYAPIGRYDKDRLANPGLNYWTFDPTVGVAYNNETNGFNAAAFLGVGVNTRNKDTDYKSGTLMHLDASVQQLLPAGPGYIGIGAEAFYIEQVGADSGSGALLGGFKGRTAGIGPVLSYLLPLGKTDRLIAELRWLHESSVRNRPEGDYIWFKVNYQY
jgi:hypothetical protein